ncbi:diacylglycerol/lipid kinase family protein [Nocardia sp. NPDC051570]|uniref:diacylglycerol/lipid kinase family protein n=1 Tax=Nocardia sp. NPDC051570 TaxID=3364324 RepID=UPI00379980CA
MTDERIRVFAIVNPAAGGDPRGLLRALHDRRELAVRAVFTEGPGDAERFAGEQAAADWAEVVVAIGGDGTVGEVAAGLHRGNATGAMLIAPAGTGNSSYCGLCEDRPWTDIVAGLATGTLARVTVDLARIEEINRIVLLGTTTGLLPATLDIARTMSGSGRDLLSDATAAALRKHRPYPVRVRIDGTVAYNDELLGTYVGGMRFRGGRFEMLPESVIDDGLLDICFLNATAAPRYGRGTRIVIERVDDRPLLIEYDGELRQLGSTCTIRALPNALEVLVPVPLPAAFGARQRAIQTPSRMIS